MKVLHIKNIYCCDFETTTIRTNYFKTYNATRVYLWGCKNIEGGDTKKGVSISSFFDYIKSTKKSALIYFHNLTFDGEFIIHYLVSEKIPLVNKLESKQYGFTIFRSDTRIFEIKINFYLKGYRKWIVILIRCSMAILTSSIEALGKDLKIDKHNKDTQEDNFYDYEPQKRLEDYPQALLDYLDRDIEIMRLALINFDKSIEEIKNNSTTNNKKMDWRTKMTIGSISYKIGRNYVYERFGKEVYRNLKIPIQKRLIYEKFFYGGFTQFNSQIQEDRVKCESGAGFDMKSAHPTSMLELLPISPLINFNKESELPQSPHLIFYEIYVKEAITNNGIIANLVNWNKRNGIKGDNTRYCFIMNNFTCYYKKEEWELLQKFYDFKGVKFINKYYCHADYILKECIEKLYHYKEKYSLENKKGIANGFKIMLNSLYGKFATRVEFNTFYVCRDKEELDYLKNGGEVSIGKNQYQYYNDSTTIAIDNHYCVNLRRVDINHIKCSNILIAASITAYTRCRMFETILKLGLENFLYADTDSIFVKNCDKMNLIKLGEKLGDWEKQYEFDEFYVRGSKCYYFKKGENIKGTYSGVNKNWLAKNMSEETFRNMDAVLENANLKKMKVKGGIVLVHKDYTPKKRGI